MMALYADLPEWDGIVTGFIGAVESLNDYMTLLCRPGLIDRRLDQQTGQVIHDEQFTNNRIVDVVLYGEKAHKTPDKAEILRHLRAMSEGPAMLDFIFVGIVGQALRVLGGLQRANAALFLHYTGETLPVFERTNPDGS